MDPCVYDVFDSASALELNPELVTLTPGTPVFGLFQQRCKELRLHSISEFIHSFRSLS